MSSEGKSIWWKIAVTIAVLIGILGVLGGVVVWQAMVKVENAFSSIEEDLPRAAEEGVTYGTAHSQEQCLQAGLERALPCGQFDIGCMAISGIFGKSCLEAAVPDPTLCEGVASPAQAEELSAWLDAECTRRGHPSSVQCLTFLQQTVTAHCVNQPR